MDITSTTGVSDIPISDQTTDSPIPAPGANQNFTKDYALLPDGSSQHTLTVQTGYRKRSNKLPYIFFYAHNAPIIYVIVIVT